MCFHCCSPPKYNQRRVRGVSQLLGQTDRHRAPSPNSRCTSLRIVHDHPYPAMHRGRGVVSDGVEWPPPHTHHTPHTTHHTWCTDGFRSQRYHTAPRTESGTLLPSSACATEPASGRSRRSALAVVAYQSRAASPCRVQWRVCQCNASWVCRQSVVHVHAAQAVNNPGRSHSDQQCLRGHGV